MKPPLFFKVAALFAVSVLPSRADWQWENDLVVAKPTAHGYEARLSFQNNGHRNVTVTGLTFSCPCTVYRFTATTAKPGETGTLIVLIDGDSVGMESRDLDFIAQGSASTQPRELTIRVE